MYRLHISNSEPMIRILWPVCPPSCCNSCSCPGALCHWVLPTCPWLVYPMSLRIVSDGEMQCVWESIQQRLLCRESPLHLSAQWETHTTRFREKKNQIISPIPSAFLVHAFTSRLDCYRLGYCSFLMQPLT